jgi:hypothetical protein
MLQGVLIDETIEVLFQRTGDFGRAPRAWAVHKPLGPLRSKAIDPFAEGGIGKVQCIGDGLEALPFDNVAYGLGTAEDTGLFRLF